MALPGQPGVVVLLLMLWWGCWGSPAPLAPLLPCPEACVCPRPSLVNCSSAGLSFAPPHSSMDRSVELDLSHNLLRSLAPRGPHTGLRALRLGNNRLSSLSLCLGTSSPAGAVPRLGRTRRNQRTRRSPRCVSWAPSLLLLSLERNDLVEIPRGLGESRGLQVLQLSYNQIPRLEPGDLEGLQQLTELHLHHNHLRSLHPQALMGLTSLTVIDLSFNLLTSLSQATSWSLPVGVRFRGAANPWRCDCDMGSLKRRMALDVDGEQNWRDMVCDSPSSLEGRDLLQLHEEDLGCPGTMDQPGFHQDLTVDRGSTVLLPCSMAEGSTWWTPKGQQSVVESQPGLLLSDVTEGDAGLYICGAETHQDVWIYHLNIREPGVERLRSSSRRPRGLPLNTQGAGGAGLKLAEVRAMSQEQHLGLAVGLSVFFTFLVAFVLGVLARPCIDVLWQKVCGKKRAPSPPRSVSPTSQTPYDNQAYSDEEADPETVSHRERRVTFSDQDHKDQSTALYMNTMGREHSPNLPDSMGQIGKARERDRLENRDVPANSKTSLSQQVELIVEEPGERWSLFSSDEEQDDTTRTQRTSAGASNSPPVVSVQQKTSDSTFISETFDHWSPPLYDTVPTDQDESNDVGEAFEFPESFQSGSARSSNQSGSFNHSEMVHFPSSGDLRQCKSTGSDCSSQVSGGEINHYTVNPDSELEGELQNSKMVPDHLDPPHSSSSDESEDEVRQYTFNPEEADEGTGRISQGIAAENNIWDIVDLSNMVRTRRRLDITVELVPVVTLKDAVPLYRTHVKPHPDIKASTGFSSSSSESEEEPGPAVDLDNLDVNRKVEQATHSSGTLNPNRAFENIAHDDRWHELDLENITGIKRRLDVKVPSQAETLSVTGRDDSHRLNPLPGKNESTDYLSSSSESEEEIIRVNPDHAYFQTKLKTANQPHFYEGTSQSKDFIINAQEDRWPALDFNGVNRVRRSLDITAKTGSTVPAVTLRNTSGLRQEQHPEITTTKTTTDLTSSSSDSDAETTGPPRNVDDTRVKAKEELVYQPSLYLGTASPRRDFDLSLRDDGGPELNLRTATGVKGRLDFKVATPSGDMTSSAGESREDHLWPKVDLNDVTGVKRRLDVKVATKPRDPAIDLKDREEDSWYHVKPRPEVRESPDSHCSSSSSESEEDFTGVNVDSTYVKTQVNNVHKYESHKVNDSEINAQEGRWPALDFNGVNRVRRSLDITATTGSTVPAVTLRNTYPEYSYHAKPNPEITKITTDLTASSSDSDAETTGPPRNVDDTRVKAKEELAYQPSLYLGTASPRSDFDLSLRDDGGPELNLRTATGVKGRLDFKVATPSGDMTSSAGESREDHLWPKVDLNNVTGVKRRLDVKVATKPRDPAIDLKDREEDSWYHVKPRPEVRESPDSHCSSSSSESEEDFTGVNVDSTYVKTQVNNVHKYESHKVNDSEINAPEDRWPALDLGKVNSIRKRLDITATETTGPAAEVRSTRQDGRWSQWDLANVSHAKRPGVHKALTDSPSSSSDEEEPCVGTKTDVRKVSAPIMHLGPNKESEMNVQKKMWPRVDLSYVPQVKQRLDFKVTESENEVEHIFQPQSHLGTVKPVGDFKVNAGEEQCPGLDLGNVPGIRRRLDIKVAMEATDPAVNLKDSDRHYMHRVNPQPRLEASTEFSSSSSESEEETTDPPVNMEYSYVQPGTVEPIKYTEINAKTDSWPELELGRLPHIKRRLDFKASTETHGSQVSLDITDNDRWPTLDLSKVTRVKSYLDVSVPPSEMTPRASGVLLQSQFSSCSNGITSEVKGEHLKPKGESHVGTMSHGTWSDLNPPIPRISRRLDIKPISPKLNPGRVDLVPVQSDTGSSTSESEDETLTHTDQRKTELPVWSPITDKESILYTRRPFNDDTFTSKRDPTMTLDKYAVIPGPEVPPDLESRLAGLHLSLSRSRKHLDVSSNYAPPKVSPGGQITQSWSFGGQWDGQSQEGDRRRIPVDNVGMIEQNNILPLVDLGTVTTIKRRLDIKVDPRPPDAQSGAGDWGPALDLDSVTAIKRRLDFKATLSSNTWDLSTEDCRGSEKSLDTGRLSECLPPVPDCSPPHSSTSSESDDDSKQENEDKMTHFAEYRTHGPARLFTQPVEGTSDPEGAGSSETGGEMGPSPLTVDGRERKGLGALRALTLQRGTWDTERLEIRTSSSYQGDASLSRSLQRADDNRLAGHYGPNDVTETDAKPLPEYFESQNFATVDLTYPMTDV